MYVLVITEHNTTLTEMTKAQIKAACAERGEARYPHYNHISGTEAHRYVKNGGHHETPLWVDAGRIRYARDSA